MAGESCRGGAPILAVAERTREQRLRVHRGSTLGKLCSWGHDSLRGFLLIGVLLAAKSLNS